jgi:hypothetical protein
MGSYSPCSDRERESVTPTAEVMDTVGRQPASACGTFSSTERSWARAASRVGLLE